MLLVILLDVDAFRWWYTVSSTLKVQEMATTTAGPISHSSSDEPTSDDPRSSSGPPPDQQREQGQPAHVDEERQVGIPLEKDIATPSKDPNRVDWEPDEKANPKNFTTAYKIFITFQLGMLAFGASLGSSIISPASQTIADDLGVGVEVTVLNVSLYV